MEAEVIMEDIIRVTGMFKIPQKWAKIHSIYSLLKKLRSSEFFAHFYGVLGTAHIMEAGLASTGRFSVPSFDAFMVAMGL